MAQRKPTLLVGGGIGGLTAALCLARVGIETHVVERAAVFEEIGAGIQLAPNANRVLETLGVVASIDHAAVKPRNVVIMDSITGVRLTSLDLGEVFRARYGQPYLLVHRNDLLNALLEACRATPGIELQNSCEVVDVLPAKTGVRVVFGNGSEEEAHAVIGADGLWSKVRSVVSNDHPVCHEYVAYRGALPISEIGHSIESNDEIVWIGPNHHLVQYPIRGGNLYNQVAVFRSHRYDPELEFTDKWGTAAELDDAFASSCAAVRRAVDGIERDRRWVMYDREPLDNWTVGRVTLLGDAAHPMVQYLAQGACQAIEDAAVLARHLGERPEDPSAAFLAYQAERIPRTEQVQRVARAWGQIWHDEGPLVPALRDRVFAARRPDDYADLDWLYQHAVMG